MRSLLGLYIMHYELISASGSRVLWLTSTYEDHLMRLAVQVLAVEWSSHPSMKPYECLSSDQIWLILDRYTIYSEGYTIKLTPIRSWFVQVFFIHMRQPKCPISSPKGINAQVEMAYLSTHNILLDGPYFGICTTTPESRMKKRAGQHVGLAGYQYGEDYPRENTHATAVGNCPRLQCRRTSH